MRSLDVIRLLATGLLALQVPAVAEDIDLFMGVSPESGDKPNVLFVIDNGANFSASASERRCIIEGVPTNLDKTSGAIEQCALYEVIKTLPDDTVRIGIMFYNGTGVVDYTGNATTCHVGGKRWGGCLAYPISVLNDETRPALLNWIRNWKTSESDSGFQVKGDGQATGASMQEAWAYYKGRMGISGRNYKDMKPPGGTCQKSDFVIFIGNSYNSSGSPADQTGDRGPKTPLESGFTKAADILKNASPLATAPQRVVMNPTIKTSCGTATLGNPHENKGYYADEWSRYMFANGITTYSIGVLGEKCQADYAALLTNMGDKNVGGGKYYATTNYEDLKLSISTILSEVQAVNSVFASVSLPVSVNPQGYYLNQIYVGMFRPDGAALPRWVGNLKQYKLGRDESGKGLRLEDAADEPAISNVSKGFISECARSYWSPDEADTYWTPFDSLAPEKMKAFFNCNLVSPSASSNFPDGNVVEKGGQGFVQRGSKVAGSFSRTVKTCDATCSSALADFATGNAAITKTMLGDAAMSDQDRTDLIEWARGANNKAGDESFVASTAVRASVHGDVVHSRPVAINFGDDTPAGRKIVVFYGANDGVLRAVNGNRGDLGDASVGEIGSVKAGAELWSFIAPETYSALSRLRKNTLPIKFKGSTTGTPKQYGIDGPITAYQSGGDTWIFTTMRRGGRAVYAFDVSDIATDPDSPTLKWKAGCDDSGCSSGFSDIGQTWSTPIPMAKVGPEAKPMLIMGGGYDPCEDTDPPDSSCKATGKGNGIYLLDADTGDFVSVFPTSRPVVGDVVVITDDNTGLPKWIYAADLGGNVYRISQGGGIGPANLPIGASAHTGWDITKIASLGCADDACSDGEVNRKFMFGPDVIDEDGTYHILLGSGDREKPLDDWSVTYNVKNFFFMIKDRPEDPDNLTVEDGSPLCETASGEGIMCLDSLAYIDLDADPTDSDLADEIGEKRGWYLELAPHEQVVTSAITVFGVSTFSTHIPTAPDPDSCEPDLGTAKVYNVDYLNSAGYGPDGVTDRSVEIKGGGLPPSPVAGRVLLDGETKPTPFIIGAEGTSPLEAKLPPSPNPNKQPKGWTYWFIGK